MTLRIISFFPVLILVFTYFSNPVVAQNQSYLGINITSNLTGEMSIKPEIGLVLEKHITNHSGIEANLNFSTYQRSGYVYTSQYSEAFSVNEKYISIPVLYKFYSKIANFGLGITYDYFVGWKQLSGSPDITSYRSGVDYLIGLIGKISKQVVLGDNLILEPEVKCNVHIQPFDRYYIGFGIIAKFKL